jgi:hypothetical protein
MKKLTICEPFLNRKTYLEKALDGTTRREDLGCQMVCFQTKNPNLGKIWRV